MREAYPSSVFHASDGSRAGGLAEVDGPSAVWLGGQGDQPLAESDGRGGVEGVVESDSEGQA